MIHNFDNLDLLEALSKYLIVSPSLHAIFFVREEASQPCLEGKYILRNSSKSMEGSGVYGGSNTRKWEMGFKDICLWCGQYRC